MTEIGNSKCAHLFFDASSLVFAAFYANAGTDTYSPVANLVATLDQAMDQFLPRHAFVVWTEGVPAAKHALLASYRATTRQRTEDEQLALASYIESCRRVFGYLPIRQLTVKGLESKDVIGFLWDKLQPPKAIVSNDLDLVQLVDQDTVLYRPVKNELITKDNVDARLGFPAKHYVLWRSLVGNSSAKVSGVAGIGPQRATQLVSSVAATGRKLPIQAHELALLERNKRLFGIGAMLTSEDKVEIINAYVRESGKDVELAAAAALCGVDNFQASFPRLYTWVSDHVRTLAGRTACK